jgi:hypothetical protein
MLSSLKERKREGIKNLSEARNILRYMEQLLLTREEDNIDRASAFFRIFNYHLEEGDLAPHNVHLAALLRRKNEHD